MKKLLLLTLLLLLAAGVALADSWAVVANPNSGDWLNLRATASTGGTVLARYYNGTFVRVTGDDTGEWVQVLIGTGPGSQSGYFMRKYLCFTPEDGTYAYELRQATATAPLTIQRRNGDEWQTLAVLPAGTALTVLGETDERYHVTAGTLCGWALKTDITATAPATLAASMTADDSGWDSVWTEQEEQTAQTEQPAQATAAPATTVISTQSANISNLWYVTLTLEQSGSSYLVRVTETLTGTPSDSISGWEVFLNGAYIGNADGYHVDTDPSTVTRYVCVLGATDTAPQTVTVVPVMEQSGLQRDIQISVSGQ